MIYVIAVWYDYAKYWLTLRAFWRDQVEIDAKPTDKNSAESRRKRYNLAFYFWIGAIAVDYITTYFSQDKSSDFYNGAHNVIDSKQSRDPQRVTFKFLWFCAIYDIYMIAIIYKHKSYLEKSIAIKKNNLAWEQQELEIQKSMR